MQNNITFNITFTNVPEWILQVIQKADIKIIEENMPVKYSQVLHADVFTSILSLYKIDELEKNGKLDEAVERVAQELYKSEIAPKLN